MIAAMAAAVSATSILRLVSARAGLSGNSALAEGVGLFGTGAGASATVPLEGAGFANGEGEAKRLMGVLLWDTFWRPIE